MTTRVNRWQASIRDQLAASDEPLSTAQIWRGMIASGFQHKSAMPRSTLGARLAEMVAQGGVSRIGPSTYQISVAVETTVQSGCTGSRAHEVQTPSVQSDCTPSVQSGCTGSLVHGEYTVCPVHDEFTPSVQSGCTGSLVHGEYTVCPVHDTARGGSR